MTSTGKVYLAGPMRGHANLNFEAFRQAAELLRDWGYEVVSPHEIDIEKGWVVYEQDDEGRFTFVEGTSTFSLKEAMRGDYAAIIWADQMVMLPGWESSAGTAQERRVANEVGTPVFEWVLKKGQPWLSQVDEDYYPPLHLVEATPPAAQLVGLAGYARAGKDTTADILEEHGFERRAFADLLKRATLTLNPSVWTADYGHHPMAMDVERLGWEGAKQIPEVRELLQRMGTEVGRELFGTNFWVEKAMATVEAGSKVVFTDVRFPNEFEAIKAAGGHVWRIERPGFGPVNGHSSETAIDGFDYDLVIHNDGSLHDLELNVAGALHGSSTGTVTAHHAEA